MPQKKLISDITILTGALFTIFAANTTNAQTFKDLNTSTPEYYHTTQVTLSDSQQAQQSLEWIIERNKTDLAPHLITAMRYSTLGRFKISTAISQLTGIKEPKSWFDWMLWQESNKNLKPHESYLDFKSNVFYKIDPAFGRFFHPKKNSISAPKKSYGAAYA
ncbi:MAG: hypothetical protein AB8B83_02165 [Bdellovibrionales bacterium]